MEEFKNITNSTSVVKISACLEKIFKKITESREKKIAEQNIKEIEFLKTQCKSDIVQLSLLSSQTFVRLVEGGVLEASNVLTMLISMLPNSSMLFFILSLHRKLVRIKSKSLQGLRINYHEFFPLQHIVLVTFYLMLAMQLLVYCSFFFRAIALPLNYATTLFPLKICAYKNRYIAGFKMVALKTIASPVITLGHCMSVNSLVKNFRKQHS